MTLDPAKVQELVDLVSRDYPGWTGFEDEQFTKEERDYKLATRQKAVGPDGLLTNARLRSLIDGNGFEAIIKDLEMIGRDSNLLYNNMPMYGDMNILYAADLDKPAFCRAMRDLLWGDEPSPTRLDRYVKFVDDNKLPQKWAFPTYLLYICREDEMFVKPEATKWLLSFLEADPGISKGPSGERYASVKSTMSKLGEALTQLGYPPADTVDLQTFLWSSYCAARKQPRPVVSPELRTNFRNRFEKFVPDYLATSAGLEHRELYEKVRATGRANFDAIVAAQDKAEDVTQRVLTQLLPHADTEAHRTGGYWIHVAPAINGDIRTWFEAAGIQTPENWPHVAEAILRFVRACEDDPFLLQAACEEFSSSPYSKGFQQGMLSPILNALRPDDYVLVNNKSRLLLSYFGQRQFGLGLVQYPEVNEFERQMVEELTDDMLALSGDTGTRTTDLFDQFCHWVIAIEKGPLAPINYWKVAPGQQARLWDAWQRGSYVSIGWERFGDLSGLTTKAFKVLQKQLCSELDDYTTTGTEQVWKFASALKLGDRIVANKGRKTVVGIGTVAGPYYFAEGDEHGHRIPVTWDDTAVRVLPKEKGWERTLVKLNSDAFNEILAISPETESEGLLAAPFDRIFPDRDTAEWWFDFARTTLQGIGVDDADDERMAVTMPKTTGESTIHLDFQTWLVGGFGPADNERPTVITAVEGMLPKDTPDFWDAFTPKDDEPVVELRWATIDGLRSDALLQQAHVESLGVIKGHFPGWRRSLHRRHHRRALAEAIFDVDARRRLLDEGLGVVEAPTLDPDAAFAPETFTLLRQLAADPTQAFYSAHREGLQTHVEGPVKLLMARVADQLAEPLTTHLETESRIFARIPKNDWGRGGAWPFYWAAFYPKGSKRVEDSQLFVFLDQNGLNYGYSIGEYGSTQRKRLVRNASANRMALVKILGDSLSALGMSYGEREKSRDDKLPDEDASLPMDEWLGALETAGVQVDILLTPDELLSMPTDDLVERIGTAFNALYPLVLLATEDDPMPAIADYLEPEPPEVVEWADEYSFEDLVEETFMEPEQLRRWLCAIERKKQAILFGPPGTGKTYVAERLARHLIGGKDGMWDIVQFHPAYAYEDFMQGIRPRPGVDNQLEYPIVPGRFLDFCTKAKAHRDTCVLVIDEINRANLARVFGELMYLLEYRKQDIALAGGDKRFRIPDNVRLLGTMNTADRSIALVDHALRRRFAFLALYPDYDVLKRFHQHSTSQFEPSKLIAVLQDLNRKIDDEHYSVGISFFMHLQLDEHLPDIWRMEIEPYLDEYFFDQSGVVDSYRWDEVLKQLS